MMRSARGDDTCDPLTTSQSDYTVMEPATASGISSRSGAQRLRRSCALNIVRCAGHSDALPLASRKHCPANESSGSRRRADDSVLNLELISNAAEVILNRFSSSPKSRAWI